ncbi:Alpha/Beta hydrolase protein [Phlyctochytrium arcticum]|nr:Alpha/Beta hydrolase protein [Phlyctochytrium arcticum]
MANKMSKESSPARKEKTAQTSSTKTQRLVSIILSLLSSLIFVYFGVLAVLAIFPEAFQSQLIYLNWVRYPRVDWQGDAREFGFRAGTVRTVRIPTTDNITLGAWHILPREHAAPIFPGNVARATEQRRFEESQSERDGRFDAELQTAASVILYFHGNLGNRATGHRIGFYKMAQTLGKNVHIIAVDYRGFGDSDGWLASESGIRLDAVAAWDWLVNTKKIHPRKIIILGHSLGTGVASYLAQNLTTERGVAGGGLILLAGYASMPDAALGYATIPLLWPFRHHPALAERAKSFVSEKWNTLHNIRRAHGWPVLILHGSRDRDIMPWQARRVFIEAVTSRCFKSDEEAVRRGKSVIQEPLEDQKSVFAPDHDRQLSATQHFTGYDLHSIAGREGWIWTSKPGDPICDGVQTSNSPVWFLEVKNGGHNNLPNFQVVQDTLTEWLLRIESKEQ